MSTILWLSGRPRQGKTPFAKTFREKGIGVFSTDDFIAQLHEWCDDPDVQARAKQGHTKIGRFLRKMVKRKKADFIAGVFLQPPHGFSPDGPLCVIEGYMPLTIQCRIAGTLEGLGHFVWYAMRDKQLRTFLKRQDWK